MDTRTHPRREHLLDAATELLATHPTATLADIAAHAGISKATLHRLFTGRDELILALAQRAVALVSDATTHSRLNDDDVEAALKRLVTALVPLGDRVYFLLSQPGLENIPGMSTTETTSDTQLAAWAVARQASGELRGDLPVVWVVHMLNYAMFAAWEAMHHGHIAPNDAAQLVTTTLLHGMRAPTPR